MHAKWKTQKSQFVNQVVDINTVTEQPSKQLQQCRCWSTQYSWCIDQLQVCGCANVKIWPMVLPYSTLTTHRSLSTWV